MGALFVLPMLMPAMTTNGQAYPSLEMATDFKNPDRPHQTIRFGHVMKLLHSKEKSFKEIAQTVSPTVVLITVKMDLAPAL